ncbi:MAG TPA: ATP-binding protein [Methylibium sp.]
MPPTVPSHDAEAQRLAVLRSLGVVDSSQSEPSLDALAESAARLLGCPAGFITLIDSDQQWIKAGYGLQTATQTLPREISFCTHLVSSQADVLEVPDASLDARFADNPFVAGEPHVRFYAGAPLPVDGCNVGTLCVIDFRPRRLSEDDRRSLRRLAQAASELLEHRRLLRRQGAEQQRLRDLARASGDWMWETDEQGRYTWISSAFDALTGLPGASLLGQPMADAPLLDEQGRSAQGSLHQLLAHGQAFVRALSEKTTPRGRLIVSRSAVPVRNGEGQLVAWRGTTRDTTQRITLLAEARARDAVLRRFSAQIPGLVFQFRRAPGGGLSFPYLSERVEDLLGVTADRVAADVEADPSHAFRLVVDEDLPGLKAAIAASELKLEPLHHEYRVRLRDGRLRWLETRATPERLDNGDTLWHAFSADVTARKQTELALRHSEERWAMAASAAGIGIAQLDLLNGTLRLDRQACLNHGLPFPHGALSLADWLAQLDPRDRPAAEAGLRQAIDAHGALEARYRIHRNVDGAERWLEILARAQYDTRGLAVGMIGTCRDVTEAQLAEQLKRDKAEAERASRAKTRFLSRMSHELRTPLNGILGFVQLMSMDRQNPLPPAQQARLDSVQWASRHLLGLINEVLDLSRIEREDFHLRLRPVELGGSLAACLALLLPLAQARGVTLAAAPAGQFWVRGDAHALEQVLMNLLSNAIKYNREDGRVWLQARFEADRLRLEVHDTGAGLDAEQRGQLFQPFVRLSREAARIEGSGLGLFIARQLAEAMGGSLDAHSEAGVGSVFRLELVRCEPAEGSGGDETQPSSRTAQATRHVVYVEDEPLNVVLLQELFRARAHWRLHVATSGSQGLELARATPADLLLIDMNLPDMDGLELLRQLRADPATRELRCVALSADALPEQIARARESGFDNYWTKPFDVTRLLGELDRLLA